MLTKFLATNKLTKEDVEVEVQCKETIVVDGCILISKERFFKEYLIKDGVYLTNHIYHPVDSRQRYVTIENGAVIVEKHRFSQFAFFEVNYIVHKLNKEPELV